MNVGLPGTGIGGIFYLASTFLMVIVEIILTLKGKSDLVRWRFVLGQLGIGTGIIFGMFVAGWIIELLFYLTHSVASSYGLTQAVPRYHVFLIKPIFWTLATLLTIVVSIQILGIVIGKNRHLRVKNP